MQFKRKLIVSLLVGGGVVADPAVALANDSSELEQLRVLVQELDQKVRILARQNELAAEDAAARKKETPVVVAGNKGFGLKSADGNFEFKLRGLLQADSRTFFDSNTSANEVLLRRVRPTFEGTVFGKYDFRFTPDFAPSATTAQDAYINARFAPWFRVQAGKFKVPASLERLQSGSDIRFNERSYVANALLPNRDVGVQLHGELFTGKVNYALGVFDGQVDGGSNSGNNDTNNDKDYAARVFFEPFKGDGSALAGLGFGISGTRGDITGSSGSTNLTTGYKTPGQATFFAYRNGATATFANGDRIRWSPQAYFYNGPFGLLAEYAHVSQDVKRINGATTRVGNLDHDAWQIAGSWVLTGEDNSFKGIAPKREFDLDKGGWGAWELVARYSELDVDSDTFAGGANSFADPQAAAKSAESWAGGVNWYLNKNVKVAAAYEHTRFDGGRKGAGTTVLDRDDEDVLFARFQVAF